MKDVRFISSRLETRMKELGYTDESLAQKIGISKTTIYYLRVGRKGKKGLYVSTSAENLAKIAHALSVSTQYLIDESADPSPIQKKMSAMVADIANVAEGLTLAKQRQLREIGKALARMELSTDVDVIYDELMDLVTHLVEIKDGDKALDKFLDYLQPMSSRVSSSSVTGRTRRGKTPETPSKFTDDIS